MDHLHIPGGVQEVMQRLLAPEVHRSLDEVATTIDVLNRMKDELTDEARGSLLSTILNVTFDPDISEIETEKVLMDKVARFESVRPSLAESLIYLVKSYKKNPNHPLRVKPLTAVETTRHDSIVKGRTDHKPEQKHKGAYERLIPSVTEFTRPSLWQSNYSTPLPSGSQSCPWITHPGYSKYPSSSEILCSPQSQSLYSTPREHFETMRHEEQQQIKSRQLQQESSLHLSRSNVCHQTTSNDHNTFRAPMRSFRCGHPPSTDNLYLVTRPQPPSQFAYRQQNEVKMSPFVKHFNSMESPESGRSVLKPLQKTSLWPSTRDEPSKGGGILCHAGRCKLTGTGVEVKGGESKKCFMVAQPNPKQNRFILPKPTAKGDDDQAAENVTSASTMKPDKGTAAKKLLEIGRAKSRTKSHSTIDVVALCCGNKERMPSSSRPTYTSTRKTQSLQLCTKTGRKSTGAFNPSDVPSHGGRLSQNTELEGEDFETNLPSGRRKECWLNNSKRFWAMHLSQNGKVSGTGTVTTKSADNPRELSVEASGIAAKKDHVSVGRHMYSNKQMDVPNMQGDVCSMQVDIQDMPRQTSQGDDDNAGVSGALKYRQQDKRHSSEVDDSCRVIIGSERPVNIYERQISTLSNDDNEEDGEELIELACSIDSKSSLQLGRPAEEPLNSNTYTCNTKYRSGSHGHNGGASDPVSAVEDVFDSEEACEDCHCWREDNDQIYCHSDIPIGKESSSKIVKSTSVQTNWGAGIGPRYENSTQRPEFSRNENSPTCCVPKLGHKREGIRSSRSVNLHQKLLPNTFLCNLLKSFSQSPESDESSDQEWLPNSRPLKMPKQSEKKVKLRRSKRQRSKGKSYIDW